MMTSGQPGKTPSDKVAYLLNFYILKPTAKLTHRIHLDEDRRSLNSVPLIIITKKPNRVFFLWLLVPGVAGMPVFLIEGCFYRDCYGVSMTGNGG